MRKVYLSLFTLALTASASFGQVAKVNKGHFRGKEKISVTDASDKATKKGSDISNKVNIYTNTFNNPGDWMLSNTSVPAQDWVFSTDPAFIGGLTWGDGPFASTTAADGYAYLDSDGAGQTATQNAIMQLANPIDCSAYPGIVLSFEQYHTRYLEQTFVSVSADGGATWTDYEVNTGVAVNANTPNPDVVQINISSVAGGQSNVLIAFRYEGAWDYGWVVDDLKLEEALGNDLIISKTYTHDIVNSYDYSMVPEDQIQPLTVGAIVNNFGGTAAVGSMVTVTINDGTSDVYNQTSPFDLAIGVTDTIWVATGFTPVVGNTYTVTFTLPADDDLTNNVSTPASFQTTAAIYAHDFTTTDIFRFNIDDESSMGNAFEAYAAADLYGVDIKFETGTTATQAIIRLSRFNPNDATYNGVQSMEFVDEVDGGQYTIPTAAIGSGNFVTALFSTPVALEAGWIYVAEVRKQQGTDRIFIGGSNEGDDDLSTVCYGPFGTGSAVNYFIGWGFSPAVRLNFAPVIAPVATSSDVDNNLCEGETLTLSSDITSPDIVWSNGQTTQSIVVSTAGTYSVTVNGVQSNSITVTTTTIDATVTPFFATLTVAETGAAYQWVDCDNANAPVVGATQQTFVPAANGNYAVVVTKNGCSETSSCNTVNTAALTEVQGLNALSIVPNPATDKIAISFDLENETAVSVSVRDLSGKVVYSSDLGSKAGKNAVSVETKSFANGIYVVSFETEKGIATEKLVINN